MTLCFPPLKVSALIIITKLMIVRLLSSLFLMSFSLHIATTDVKVVSPWAAESGIPSSNEAQLGLACSFCGAYLISSSLADNFPPTRHVFICLSQFFLTLSLISQQAIFHVSISSSPIPPCPSEMRAPYAP